MTVTSKEQKHPLAFGSNSGKGRQISHPIRYADMCWAQWHIPIIPAIQEAKAEGLQV